MTVAGETMLLKLREVACVYGPMFQTGRATGGRLAQSVRSSMRRKPREGVELLASVPTLAS